MPKKLRIGNVLLADYVAEGHGNKFTIVNALTGNIKVPILPAQLGVGLLAELIIQEGQTNAINLEIFVDNKLVFGATATLVNPPKVGEPATLAIPHFPIPVEKDSTLELYLSAEGFQRTLAMRKLVYKDTNSSTAAGQPSAQSGNAAL